jgi:putative DNA primase/helicase
MPVPPRTTVSHPRPAAQPTSANGELHARRPRKRQATARQAIPVAVGVPVSAQPLPQRLGDVLPDAPPPAADIVIPPPYLLREDGVIMICGTGDTSRAYRLAPAPLAPTARIVGEDGEQALRLAWCRPDSGWQHVDVPRDAALTARAITAYAECGLPVDSTAAAAVVRYIHEVEAANWSRLATIRQTHRTGWHGTQFVLGHIAIPNDPPLVYRPASSGDERLVGALTQEGSLDAWRDAISMLADHPIAQIVLYAAFAPPLLAILHVPNFILSLSGPTSTGKTTALRAAASVWGCPDERQPHSLIAGWNTTLVHLERAAAALCDLPLLVDDTAAIRDRDRDIVPAILYMVASGRGRGRGERRAGTQPTATWRTVMIASGEGPITSHSQQGGTRMRVIELSAPPFGPASPETARRLRSLSATLRAHHGHAGRRFLEALIRERDRWEALREEHRAIQDHYLALADGPGAERMAEYAATIGLAGRMAHRCLGLPWPWHDPLIELWPDIAASTEDAPGHLRALADAVAAAAGQVARFYSPERQEPAAGWLGEWGADGSISWLAPALHELLRRLGYEPVAILRAWRDAGWLLTDPGRTTRSAWFAPAKRSVRMVTLRPEAVRLAGGADPSHPEDADDVPF